MNFVMLSLVTLLAANPSSPIALFPFQGINVHPGHLEAARAVLKLHLEGLEREVVLVPAPDGTSDSEAVTSTAQAARAATLGASQYITASLTRLGERVKVQLVLHDAADGHALKKTLLDAQSPEDLDPVLARIARHLVTGEPLTMANIDEVTEREQDALRRSESNNYFGVLITGSVPIISPSDNIRFLAGPGVYWLYDARTWMGEINASMAFAEHQQQYSVLIDVLYPFLRTDFTPYAGAGLGWGGNSVDSDMNGGLVMYGVAGVIVGRSSTVHVRFDLRPHFGAFKINSRYVYGADFSLGLGF